MGFVTSERASVGALYWGAFGEKLAAAFRDVETGARVVTAGLRADRMLVARFAGKVVGVCGYYQDGRGTADLSWRHLRGHLSRTASVRAVGVLSLLSRHGRPGVLVLDGICVNEAHRGHGIGSMLLDAAVELARERGDRAVQLSVIDTNPRAAALYRRRGFTTVDRGSLGPLQHLYGFEHYTTMRKKTDA
ncbi:GNAT family N-acetyltransferase [Isoptericola halotolerans]|uniref:Ribosomal protein S18 acetylase RimI-like enzyme n=1 Tax=Isoptericola halotolerans TaxID=300560 RepID=A0ABX2A7C7_9MICO|nr:GNAT family N-acetyltransferase [Isoptericola halotolerans]NOV98772.1 ribosomal protein S18 acetylase RimI-like enzyme [Isoptericola halotolerans]